MTDYDVHENPYLKLPEEYRKLASLIAAHHDPLHDFASTKDELASLAILIGADRVLSRREDIRRAVAWSIAIRNTVSARSDQPARIVSVAVDGLMYYVHVPRGVARAQRIHYDPYAKAGRYAIDYRTCGPRDLAHISQLTARILNNMMRKYGVEARVNVSWHCGKAFPWECEIDHISRKNGGPERHLTSWHMPWGWLHSLRYAPPPRKGYIPLFVVPDGETLRVTALVLEDVWRITLQEFPKRVE